jgi:hypothetical protein
MTEAGLHRIGLSGEAGEQLVGPPPEAGAGAVVDSPCDHADADAESNAQVRREPGGLKPRFVHAWRCDRSHR